MNKLETRTINGIQITPVYYRIWHGEYSTGEWFEDVFQFFTDAKVRELETERDKINTLPPIPWEATAQELARHEQALTHQRGLCSAIEKRREELSELYMEGSLGWSQED